MARPPLAPKVFDEQKFSSMVEPLTVRIERITGNQRSPIPMPTEDGSEYPAGSGLSRESVRGIEQWLVTEWAGGGMFELTCSDAAEPSTTMKWIVFWDPKLYPPKTPPTLADAASQAAPPMPQNAIAAMQMPSAPAFSTPFNRGPSMSFSNGLPPGMPQQPFYPQPQQQYYQMPPPPPVASPQYPAWREESKNRQQEEELKALREQAARTEREATEARHKAEIDRLRIDAEAKANATRGDTERQLNEMRTMIASLTTTIKDSQARPAVDPQLEAMKLQLAAAQKAADDARIEMQRKADEDRREREIERREREAEKRDAETRALVLRQSEEAARKFDALVAQMTANKPDQMAPIITMMQEQSRNHSEAIKELTRSNQSAMERMQTNVMNPRDIIAMAREQQAGTDVATERMGNMYGRMLDLQQKATEQLIGMQPGGSGVIDVVRDSITNVKEVAERYIGAKSASERFGAQAQASVAEAQARAVEANAYAAASANATANGTAQPPLPPRAAAGFAGASTAAASVGDVAPGPKILGKTELEWFTAAFVEDVREARKEIDTYLESIAMDPVRLDTKGEPKGASPAMTADQIIQVAMMAQQQKARIPALDLLLFQERFADFVDVLVPNAPQPYRDDVVQLVIETLKRMSGQEPSPKPATTKPDLKVVAKPVEAEAEADDDEDGAEDDEEPTDDAGHDGKVVPPPVSAKNKPNGRARA